MRNLILVVHTSLDGFVAGLKGELDWFETGEENLDFVCKLTEEADAAIFGRISYQLLDSYWSTAKDLPHATKGQVSYSNWYNSATKIIISKTIAEKNSNKNIIIGNDIHQEITTIKRQAGKNILIFGSPSVAQILMQVDLIDDYWIFINPIIFAEGIPLFTGTLFKSKLKLLATKQFRNGELALNYTVDRL